MRKTLFILLGVLVALPALALEFTYEYEGQTLKYSTIDNEEKVSVAVVDNTLSGALVIPDKVTNEGQEYSVTQISSSAFKDCNNLISVAIPNSVTSIGISAFYGCSGLMSVEFGNSVSLIDMFAFYKCPALTSVTIPKSVTYISTDAFTYCTSLTEILVDKDNENYKSIDGVLFNKDASTIMCFPGGKTNVSYEIPNSVTKIGGSAFEGCATLTSVTIPISVTEIESEAFWNCIALTEITIPNAVKTIGRNAFYSCNALKEITIPNSVSVIGENAFAYCNSLKKATISDGSEAIKFNNRVFNATKLETIYLGRNFSCTALNIEDYPFSRKSTLAKLTIGNSVSEIPASAFAGCNGIKKVICLGNNPAVGSNDDFDKEVYEGATLFVPQGCTAQYKTVVPWTNFYNIEEHNGDLGAVEDLQILDNKRFNIFNINGIKIANSIENLSPGIYIVSCGNSIKKIIVE